MFERFNDGTRRVLVLAQNEAHLLGHGFIGCEHIFLGLNRIEVGVAAQALESLGITYGRLREVIGQAAPPTDAGASSLPFTPRAKQVLEIAVRTAQFLGQDYVGPEHILLGILQAGENPAVRALEKMGIEPSRVEEAVLEVLDAPRSPEDLPRPNRHASDHPLRERSASLRYPTRLVPGPSEPIEIEGLECRIVGVLVFEEDFEIVWSVAGSHDLLWLQLGVLEDNDHPPAGTTPRRMTVIVDDVGTNYQYESRAFMRTSSRWSGHVVCWPIPPSEARYLRLIWMDRSVEIRL